MSTLAAWRALALLGALLAAPWLAHAQGAWFDGPRPAPVALEAVALLADAASHGLDPADYGAGPLQRAVQAARQGPPPTPVQVERLGLALDAAVQRYLQHLHGGRVDPRQVHQRFKPPGRSAFDAAGALRAALAAGRLAGAVASAVPQLPIYDALRQALARYQELSDHPAWRQGLPPLPPPARRGAMAALDPGQAWPGLAALAARLHLLGDLPPAAVAPSSASVLYDGALVEAVKAFQRRHGLAVDGVIGRATWAALQVGPAKRARQIELTLERLRWTPLLQGPRMVVINVPEFVLRAYEVHDGQVRVRQTMKVIVGRAYRHRTPLFIEPLRRIEFRPFWNVPAAIARQELVPQLRRSPGHFEAAGYEVVGPGGTVSSALRPGLLDEVLAGTARIRQRPGPHNALGDVKFVFPNDDAIYLHHTPAVGLFQRDRRDFSHGCIRVEQPVALAAFVLARQPGWDEARIRAAMAAENPSTVTLDEPVPVLIAYGTALVAQGQERFFDDVYGYDDVLDRALRARRLPPLPAPF
ncbi:MAG: murein L,D-transpeptidase [Leptothrix sp. (in: Bacteria)]|nr:murein L,D-transpeptidase [Leptothrix sp. (in: b-proteobacteria)]